MLSIQTKASKSLSKLGFLACALTFAACSKEATPEPNASSGPQPNTPAESDSASSQLSSNAWFEDSTATSGIAFVHDAGLSEAKHLPETMGAGAALFDVDSDGDLDLYFVQGGPMRLGGTKPGTFQDPPAQSATSLPSNQLLLNDGKGHFKNATAASGAAADTGYGMGVVAGDVNGDGHQDLFVTNLGLDRLLLGDGKGSFQDHTEAAGLLHNAWTGGAALFDADGDGDLDLYVVGYVLVDLNQPEWCGRREEGWRSACHPDRYPGLADQFYLNRGDGTFQEATVTAGLSDNHGKGLGVVPFDMDGDHDLDLYVANDSVENRLWVNRGDGTFEDGTLLSGTGVNRMGATEAGMGLAIADTDSDGDLDLFVTNFDNESNTFYRNEGAGLFSDHTVRVGLEAASRLPVGFGCVFSDFDLDGDPDLAVTNGHIIDNIHLYHDGKTHAQKAQLFENQAGHFSQLKQQAEALSAQQLVGRGLYCGDLDGDGDPDLVLTQCGSKALVFTNQIGNDAKLKGFTPSPQLRNAVVELTWADGSKQLLHCSFQPSYFGQSPNVCMPQADLADLKRLRIREPGKEWRVATVDELQ